MEYNYDIIIIGSGPGGEGAAMKATRNGQKVAIIEDDAIGGGCNNWGTIPSKALRQLSREIWHNNKHYDFPEMLDTSFEIVLKQREIKKNRYAENEIDVFYGFASFLDKHKIKISRKNGSTEVITAKKFILSTGSRPYQPNDIDFTHPRILDSDKLLELKDKQIRSITIYGAGVIGCEYASILGTLNIQVNLINTRDKLMSFLDNEIIETLTNHFTVNQKIHLIHNETYKSIKAKGDKVITTLNSGRIIESDYVLFALGRAGNTEGLNLDKIGVEYNPQRGLVQVNDNYQTTQENIYAVGDVIGFPSLASSAFNQGRFAATHIIDGSCNDKLVEDIPTGIYTRPEISCIGKTEEQLTEENVPYEVGRAYFKDLARAQISSSVTGMLKILFHKETFEILGIHTFGHRVSEIIHIGQAIKSMPGKHNTIKYFLNTTFNYPTMAEAYRIAAIDGVNKLRPKNGVVAKAKKDNK
ncbi:Si-specific NAD(P)(+) transhydrogenase [Francisella uliginis]|uniref:Soluble pyridine nucleotide transhydrogenase n=1 Tax=Francisella uliginis TaxID=573570 RepID=A0A1L4BS23_9GAMM|nr:Si-specific NAD(P)(+) transhydrogenase [Francisella uliginis]API86638.1 NAD(P)(+) transhydrogenase [Francisella uliginis]